MTVYSFAPNAVLNPETGEPVVFGTGKIFLPTDMAFANPLTITTSVGVTTTEVKVRNGGSESFTITASGFVYWWDPSGGIPPIGLQAVATGLPPAGLAGQVLAKASNADYDVSWIDPPAGSGGGGGGGGTSNGDYWNRTQTVPVITISATAPWPTSAPEGALIVRLTGTGA